MIIGKKKIIIRKIIFNLQIRIINKIYYRKLNIIQYVMIKNI